MRTFIRYLCLARRVAHFCISDDLYDPPFRFDTANVQSILVLFRSSFFKEGLWYALVMFVKRGTEAKVLKTRKLLLERSFFCESMYIALDVLQSGHERSS